jgi:hypothetical protein
VYWVMRLKQSSAVHFQALVSENVTLPGFVASGQLINSPTAKASTKSRRLLRSFLPRMSRIYTDGELLRNFCFGPQKAQMSQKCICAFCEICGNVCIRLWRRGFATEAQTQKKAEDYFVVFLPRISRIYTDGELLRNFCFWFEKTLRAQKCICAFCEICGNVCIRLWRRGFATEAHRRKQKTTS